MKNTQTKDINKVKIFYVLEGDEAKRFLAYKKQEFIKQNAVLARKLMLERLSEKTASHSESKAA